MIDILQLNPGNITLNGWTEVLDRSGFLLRKPNVPMRKFIFWPCTLSKDFEQTNNFKILQQGQYCKDSAQETLLQGNLLENIGKGMELSIGVTFPFHTEEHLKLLVRRMKDMLHRFENYIGFAHSSLITIRCREENTDGYCVIVKANQEWFQNTFLYHTLLNSLRASLGFKKNNKNLQDYDFIKTYYYKYAGGYESGENLTRVTPSAYKWQIEFVKLFRKYRELFELNTTTYQDLYDKYVGMKSISIMQYKRLPTNIYNPITAGYFMKRGVKLFRGEYANIALTLLEDSDKLETIFKVRAQAPTPEEYQSVVVSLEDLCQKIMKIIHPELSLA